MDPREQARFRADRSEPQDGTDDRDDRVQRALERLGHGTREQERLAPIPFGQFLSLVATEPQTYLRNVFQVFHDMVHAYVGPGVDEYPDDPESIHFLHYDCDPLFVEDADHPFFADRIFANRLMNLVESLRSGAQQNKIYIFDGPPGCGKSTFLNNLLAKYEEYASTPAGLRYEVIWRLDRRLLGEVLDDERDSLRRLRETTLRPAAPDDGHSATAASEPNGVLQDRFTPHQRAQHLELPCPSHDNPILLVPREQREAFLDDLLGQAEFKWRLSTAKEYEWVFRDLPCTICSSLYDALLGRLRDPERVMQMLYVRPYRVSRRLGQGVTVFNPGDPPIRRNVLTNPFLQEGLDRLLLEGAEVRYLFSRFAKTHGGVYALMDIKSHNTERLIELHNIVSEGVHKVEDIEEQVQSLFLAVMNPEDRQNVEGIPSFSDRIQTVYIPYVMDVKTEVAIYRNVFGRHIDLSFLPGVLENFARVIIATRLNETSPAMQDWIDDPERYALYCDENLLLLKMEIYSGKIPNWLSEEDRKKFNARRRRRIIAESEDEGKQGFSGRDAIKLFGDLYGSYAREYKLVDMSALCNYFNKVDKQEPGHIPEGFLDSLLRMYDYSVLQEIKESLYYYNEEQISREIQNYLFALNFEPGATAVCTFTGDRLRISEEFFEGIERRLLGEGVENDRRLAFRKDIQQRYTSRTLTQEIMLEGRPITETELYRSLHERYVHNLKERVLDPFLRNENFRRAIKDYGTVEFRTYDKRIRTDVTFLMNNLRDRYGYTEHGAKEVCIYVIDNEIAAKFAGEEPEGESGD